LVTDLRVAEDVASFFVDNFFDNPIDKPKQRDQLKLEVSEGGEKRRRGGERGSDRVVCSSGVQRPERALRGHRQPAGTRADIDVLAISPAALWPVRFGLWQREIRSALLAAREKGSICGCVGIETKVVRNGRISRISVAADLEVSAHCHAEGSYGTCGFTASAHSAGSRGGVVAGDRKPRGRQEVSGVISATGWVRLDSYIDVWAHNLLPSARRKGIGKNLLAECESVIAGWGFESAWLLVDESNIPAKRLYENAGFEILYRDPKGVKIVPSEVRVVCLACCVWARACVPHVCIHGSWSASNVYKQASWCIHFTVAVEGVHSHKSVHEEGLGEESQGLPQPVRPLLRLREQQSK
jgi:ribosomal protein S18 acetylase RimI-like enzyme